MTTNAETRAQLEKQLAITRAMLDEYVRMADTLEFCPAWLSTMGQMDCRLEIFILERDLAKLGNS